MRGFKSNWNREDDFQPAICAAVAFASGHDTAQAVRSLGVTAMAFDAEPDLGSLL